MALVKPRTVHFPDGSRTSVRIEEYFWQVMDHILIEANCTLPYLLNEIRKISPRNFSSAIRLFCMSYAFNKVKEMPKGKTKLKVVR